MRLYVYVLEARGLRDPDGELDAYAKLQVGRHKSRTRTVRRSRDPVWNEEFVFRVEDGEVEEELKVGVFRDGVELLGRARVPVWTVLGEDNHTLPPTWFSLHLDGGGGSETEDCGKILLTLSLYGRRNGKSVSFNSLAGTRISNSTSREEIEHPGVQSLTNASIKTSGKSMSRSEERPSVQALAGHYVQKLLNRSEDSSKNFPGIDDSLESSDKKLGNGSIADETFSADHFKEFIETLKSRDDEMPENLQGGILLEQTYEMTPKDLNMLLFEPNSKFRGDVTELQGSTNYKEGPWTWTCGEMSRLRRQVTYIKSASKLVKAVKATEEQTYLKANGKSFAILASVTTPEVPYGDCFHVDLLYRIMPGPELPSGEESSLLIISWEINFTQSCVMKGVIEGGARQGLKDSYNIFADFLAQTVKPVNYAELSLDKEQILEPLQLEHQSDWELAREYFWDFTVVSTIFMFLYVFLHILLSGESKIQGLEFNGLDLPDTFGELITSGILVLQGESVFNKIKHFVQARFHKGSDHGVKAQGDGWLLTVALVEGNNLPSVASAGYLDPYVVFTCNGQTRTSSVQLQTLDPQWNGELAEILEFDAMEEPPSMLDVEVFDFDGPFDMSASLGHAEVNFLKHASSELADICVPLEGKLAQASQSKLHLRIFLDNTKGVESIKEYLTKMEKEVGKKLNLRSPHKNSTFQRLFGLPPEEFLISDFSCHLRRKLPLQGRLYLSARVVGFYSNLFGYKTKFYFLWEDIEDIQVIPPSFATVGSPLLCIILRKGRGLDARDSSKSQDEEGRLKFYFQSFASFNMASRTIIALWKGKTLNTEQQVQKAGCEQQQHHETIADTASFLYSVEGNLSKVDSTVLHVHVDSLMKMYCGGKLEQKVMRKAGFLNYTSTPWTSASPYVSERQTQYKFNRHVSIFGGEVTTTQRKWQILDGSGWAIEEVMTFHSVPFGDCFKVNLRYEIVPCGTSSMACQCDVFIGVAWLKSTIFQKRISKNISERLTHRQREIFYLAEFEILLRKAKKGM